MSTKRFIRQEFLNDIMHNAQNVLDNKKVLVLGAGGLGSPVLFYLAAAGIGYITIVDNDVINESNLNRQILYTIEMIGKPKVQMAAITIKSFNPQISVEPLNDTITSELLESIIPRNDLIFDCCDNHTTRMIIAKSCRKYNTPCIVTGLNKLEGFTFLYIPNKTACYGCLYNSNNIKKIEFPQVLGANAGVFGSLAANLGIQYLLNNYEIGKMLLADLYSNKFEKIELNRKPNCEVCSNLA